MSETIKIQESQSNETTLGSAGLPSQVPGVPTTVSATAEASGGLAPGAFIEPDIDEELFRFNSDDTPLMNLMLKAKKVNVNSPEVDHYMIDEPVAVVRTSARVPRSNSPFTTLPLETGSEAIPRPYSTLLVKGVNGYETDGRTETEGKDLMLFVTGRSNETGAPVVRACNGHKSDPNSRISMVPEIPKGTEIVLLGNALYETQKEVEPDMIVPQPTTIYLQKRGMNQVVSDYFDSQRKRIPFSKSVIAEQAIANFKTRGNRTLWASRAAKFEIDTQKVGIQTVYTTEGLRWQFKKEVVLDGKLTVESIIGIAKVFFTGEDVPKTAILLAGKNLLERIQCIDYSKHPEVQITTKTNSIGWTVTNFHTVFGDIEIKREPTLDSLGWSDSGALIGENRLVHYVYRSESKFQDKVDGEEATRSGLLVWDGLALKGSCHLWINGEGAASGVGIAMELWSSAEAPVVEEDEESPVYYLTEDCPGISPAARVGTCWKWDGQNWSEQ